MPKKKKKDPWWYSPYHEQIYIDRDTVEKSARNVLNMVQQELETKPRIRRIISFDEALLEWVDKRVESDYHIRDRSHFIEVLIREYKEKIEAE